MPPMRIRSWTPIHRPSTLPMRKVLTMVARTLPARLTPPRTNRSRSGLDLPLLPASYPTLPRPTTALSSAVGPGMARGKAHPIPQRGAGRPEQVPCKTTAPSTTSRTACLPANPSTPSRTARHLAPKHPPSPKSRWQPPESPNSPPSLPPSPRAHPTQCSHKHRPRRSRSRPGCRPHWPPLPNDCTTRILLESRSHPTL